MHCWYKYTQEALCILWKFQDGGKLTRLPLDDNRGSFRRNFHGYRYENPRQDMGQIQAVKKMLTSETWTWRVMAIIQLTRMRQNERELSETCIAVTFGLSDLAIIRSYSSLNKIMSIGVKIITPLTSNWNNEIRARHLYRRDIKMAK